MNHPHRSTTHQEKFFHFHHLEYGIPAGKLAIINNEICHYKFKAATAFCRLDKELMVWSASFAFCIHGDQFSRARGRTIARRKWFANPPHSFGTECTYDIVEAKLKEILNAQ